MELRTTYKCFVYGLLLLAPIEAETLTPFTGISQSALGSFQDESKWFQLTALLSTPALIYSGADTKVHNMGVRNSWADPYTIPAVWGGYLAPLTLGVGFWGYGMISPEGEAARIGSIVLQSTLLSFSYQSALKIITGRQNPDTIEYAEDQASKKFRFGFNKGGIDWGWPSGLMMINTSSLIALNTVYTDNLALQIGSSLWLGYVFLSNPVHEAGSLAWLSDAVAGTLMGIAIGRSVGKTFSDQKTKPSRIDVQPILGSAKGIHILVRI